MAGQERHCVHRPTFYGPTLCSPLPLQGQEFYSKTGGVSTLYPVCRRIHGLEFDVL